MLKIYGIILDSRIEKKGVWKLILSNRLKNYTNDKRKLTAIISIAIMIILAIILIKCNFKIAYKVRLSCIPKEVLIVGLIVLFGILSP